MLQSVRPSTLLALTLGAAVALTAPLSAASVITRQVSPVYVAKFTVSGDAPAVYSGATTFNVAKDGKVTGKMTLDTPQSVEAALGGAVKDDTWTFSYTFAMAQQNCQGTLTGTAKVSKDRKLIEGTAKIAGACVPQPLDATFSFTQKPTGLRA